MRAFDDVSMTIGLSKNKRWIQKAASFFLTTKRGKGLPKREDIKQDISYTAFDGDTGDLSKLGLIPLKDCCPLQK